MTVTVLSINLSNLPIFAQVCISKGGNSSCGPALTKVSMPTSSNYPMNVRILLKIYIVYLCFHSLTNMLLQENLLSTLSSLSSLQNRN